MADLKGAGTNDIGLNYKGLLNIDSTINTPLDGTLRPITDGMGTALPISVSTSSIAISSPTAGGNAIAVTITTAIGGGFKIGGSTATGGGMWANSVTPSSTNYAVYADATVTAINGVTSSGLYVGNTNKLLATSTGIGIGVTPTYPLDVKNATTGTRVIAARFVGGDGHGLMLGQYGAGGGSAAMWFSGVTPSATNYIFLTDTNTAQFNAPVSLFFNIADSVKMTLNSTGFGIGTTPSYKLDVLGSSTSGIAIASQIIGGTGTSAGGLKLGAFDSTQGGFWSAAVTPSSSNFALLAGNGTTDINATTTLYFDISASTKMTLTSTALVVTTGVNVGIGRSVSAARIEVQGAAATDIARFYQSDGTTLAFTVAADGALTAGRGLSVGDVTEGLRLPGISGQIRSGSVANSWRIVDGSTTGLFIQLGGGTTSFPAIKRNGTGIDFKLADDSGYAQISPKGVNIPNNGNGYVIDGFSSMLKADYLLLYSGFCMRADVATSGGAVMTTGGGTSATCSASALVDMQSTTKGFLPPRMTTTQRDAISSPAAGLLIYNTTTGKLNIFTTVWEAVTSV